MTRFRAAATSLVLFLVLLVAAPAHAVAPAITLTPNVGAPGSATTVAGTGFAASSLVDVYVDLQQVGFVVTNGAGGFSYDLTVPSTAVPGAHPVTALAHGGSAAAQAAFTVRTNWPLWRGDATNRGTSTLENVLSPSTVGGLDLDWSLTGFSVTATPVISSDSIYLVSSDGHLRAYNRTTHALLFNQAVGANYILPPAFGSNRVFVVTSGELQARKPTNGTLIWHAAIPGQIGAPVVSGGMVYVVAEGSGTTGVAGVYAFNVGCGDLGATCTPIWFGPGGSDFSGYIPENSVAVGGGRVVARLLDSTYVFNVGCATGGGSCTPTSTASGSTSTAPTIANNFVYEIEGSNLAVRRLSCLYCLSWTGPLPESGYRTVTVSGSRVYVASGQHLTVFSTTCGGSTCGPLWSLNLNSVTNPPVVANGVLYVPTANDITAFPVNCYSGCPASWNAGGGGYFGNEPYSSPVVSDGKVYTPSDDGLEVYALATAPSIATVVPSRLHPSPRFAAAEARAATRLARAS